ncbi:cyclin-like protein [Fistulina hepatica ATCC 64428]|uniref:Cyclin-like protein n=1 Tax=Fistulina hepatica ATCC 64428 TaxID=1128425 RepID=A0A0D7A3S4_9AGAR|nr:cyclin-like protein [Fistulina hepatica ATCC 64428]
MPSKTTKSGSPNPPLVAGPSESGRRPLYEGSTQFRNWRHSPEKLRQIRESLNHAAVEVIRNTYEADEPGSSSHIQFLSADEEILLVRFYMTKISALCSGLRFSEEVEATALSYLKRFYLKNTVMDWHPKNVMLTAVFLATKTTNNPVSLDGFTSKIKGTAPSDVLELEFLVAQSLGFEFTVWHAHRALWGLWLDLQSVLDTPSDRQPADPEVYKQAQAFIASSRLTDAELIYTPSQIAMAALWTVAPDLVTQWIEAKVLARSTSILASIKALVDATGTTPDVESLREIDRRLRLCKNPEKVPGTKAYLARKAEEERRTQAKRARKRAAEGKDEDPFGEHIDDDDDDD